MDDRLESDLTGYEPALGGQRRIDPRILSDLRAGRWFVVERLRHQNSQLSGPQRTRYARALLEQLLSISDDRRPPLSRDPRGPILLLLGVLGDRVALPSLIAALRDENIAVRHAAIQGLGRLDDPEAIQPLLDMLDSALADHTTVKSTLVIDALGLLGRLDQERIVPRLLDLLTSDVSPDVKLSTLTALGRIGDTRALRTLLDVLHTHSVSRHRREAALALAHIDHETVLPALIAVLNDRHRNVRIAAATAIGHLGDSTARQALQAAHQNERVADVRASIQQALERLIPDAPTPHTPDPSPWFGRSDVPETTPNET